MNRPLVPCSCASIVEQLFRLLNSDTACGEALQPVLFQAKRQCEGCRCTGLLMLVAIAIEVAEPNYCATECYAASFRRQADGNGLTLDEARAFAWLRFDALSGRAGRASAMHYKLRARYVAAAETASAALTAIEEGVASRPVLVRA